jgi:ketosteroid isomerase-like protein
VRLVGRHVGKFLGVPASGARLEWFTHEIWRVAGGRFVERWAVDDLAGLFRQMGVALPAWRAGGVPSAAEVVGRYYELANAGDWERWCDLFSTDLVMDEQLAGHVEGIGALRELMRGFPAAWRRFANVPTRRVVDGHQVAVFSHISAESAAGAVVEAEVANYFRVEDGLITYLTNVHDTVPFQDRAAASTNQ